MIALLALAGCDSDRPAEDTGAAAPPVPVAPATPPDGMSAAELRRKLGANANARFERAGGEIVVAELNESGVTDLSALRGLPIRRLGISGLPVTDLSPLAGMPLEELTAEGTPVANLAPLAGAPLVDLYLRETKVVDLAPLAGAPIERLNVVGTAVTDLSPVREMPLDTLWVASTPVSDLSPLAGKRLASLDVENTPVADVSVLKEMTTLRRLNIAGSGVKDLTPLAGLQLERLIFTPAKIEKGMEVVRGMASLQTLATTFDEPLPAATFWARYDVGDFGEPVPAAGAP